MSTAATKNITLKSSDGETFEVDEAAAQQSQTIKHLIEDQCADSAIPLPNVPARILAKVIEYCKKHAVQPAVVDEAKDTKKWDADFVLVDQATLLGLILAANYLNIKGLLDLTVQTVADMIRGRSAEEIRALLHIKNDFTPEEEQQIRNANQWAFQ